MLFAQTRSSGLQIALSTRYKARFQGLVVYRVRSRPDTAALDIRESTRIIALLEGVAGRLSARLLGLLIHYRLQLLTKFTSSIGQRAKSASPSFRFNG